MPHVIESAELVQVLAEAEDIARSVNQKLTTAHQLLALFTIPNRAEVLLRDRGIDEDKILEALSGKPEETEGTEREIRERQAKALCATCPVRGECLAYAISRPEKYGTWGGLNEEERASERRRRMRRANAA